MAVAESTIREIPQTSTVFQNIMVAADYSEASQRALAKAAALATGREVRLTAIHVAHADWRYEMLDRPQMELERSDEQHRLRAFIDQIHSDRAIGATVITSASVAQTIGAALADTRADLLVIGTRGRGGVTKIALGSVAEELLRGAPCPVMTIGPKAEISSETGFHAILFATDFGRGATKAVPLAVGLAKAYRAKLILLHMLAPAPLPSNRLSAFGPFAAGADEVVEWERASRKRGLSELRDCLPPDCGLERPPELIVGTDFLPEGILIAAEKYKADLIVMGAHRAGSGAAHNPWTAVHEVVRDAPCPVLTVAG